MSAPRLKLRQAGLDWREVDEEVVALDVSTERYLAANRTGSVLWEALAEGATSDQLVTLLLQTYAVDRETAERDVEGFIAEVREHGLLDEQPG